MLQQFRNTGYFFDDYFDLFIKTTGRELTWFQLCYDKYNNQHAITWSREGYVAHNRVDEDSSAESHYMMPILVRDGFFDSHKIAFRFMESSGNLEPWIRDKILEVINHYENKE